MKSCATTTPHLPHAWLDKSRALAALMSCPGVFDRPTALAAAERVAAYLAGDPFKDWYVAAWNTPTSPGDREGVLLRADLVALVAAVGWTATPDEAAVTEPDRTEAMFE